MQSLFGDQISLNNVLQGNSLSLFLEVFSDHFSALIRYDAEVFAGPFGTGGDLLVGFS